MRKLVASFVLGCLALSSGACRPPQIRPREAASAPTEPVRSAPNSPAAEPSSAVFGAALKASASVPVARAQASEVTNGPGWVPIHSTPSGGLAFSSNGLWFASFVDGGLLLGDSGSGRPLAVAPFVFDKSNALAFHPSSRYLVALADFTALVLAIETQGDRVRLRREADLPAAGDPGLVPPAFDRTGRYPARAVGSFTNSRACLTTC
jgi:hypothetical protein